MFGASVSRRKIQFRVCTFLRYYYYSSCPRSFATLPELRKSSLVICVKSIPIGVFWIWPWFQNFGGSIALCQSLSTRASPSCDTRDEFLNQILSDMKDSTVSHVKICETQVDRLCSVGDLGTAARLVQSLRDKEISLSLCTYNCLLEAAAEQGDFDILSQSFKYLLASSDSIHLNSFLTIANAFVKKNDDIFLLRFVKELSEFTFPRNLTIMNRILYAFGECRQVEKALLIFEHMKTLNCEPDLVTYNTILLLLGRCGRVDDMLRQFASMKKLNIVPDTISYNTMFNGLRKVGRVDLCSAIFKEMGEQGVAPDLRTYTELIDISGKSGNIDESLRLFYEMKSRRIRPSIYVYRSLIDCLKKMGKLTLAAQFSKEMDVQLPDLVGPKDFKRKKR